MVEWWLSLRSESERFLLLFALAPDPAFRSLGGNLNVAMFQVPTSSSILSKKEGNLPSSKNHWALLMHRTHPKNFQGLHNNLARYYLFSPSIQKPYHVPVFLQFNCNNQMRHELNQTKRWVFQLHQSKGKKVRLIWDDRCWMADWLHR